MSHEPAAEPEYWLPEEFAAVIRKHPKSVYRLLKQDPTFPHIRVGGSVRIPRLRARRWLEARTAGRAAR
jgi:hypothetical protein